jgi:hypothetical protein
MKEKFYKVVSCNRTDNTLVRKSLYSSSLQSCFWGNYSLTYFPLQETIPTEGPCFVFDSICHARLAQRGFTDGTNEIWECEGERIKIKYGKMQRTREIVGLSIDENSVFVKSVTLTKFLE